MAPSFFWLGLKLFLLLFLFLWFRATFPRYRYDQIMRLGWKALIPVTIVWIVVEGMLVHLKVGPGLPGTSDLRLKWLQIFSRRFPPPPPPPPPPLCPSC